MFYNCIYPFSRMTTFFYRIDYFAMISAYCERRRLRFRFDFFAFLTFSNDTWFFFYLIGRIRENLSLLFDPEVRLQWCSECVFYKLEAHLSWIWSSFWLASVRSSHHFLPFYDLFWLNTLSFGFYFLGGVDLSFFAFWGSRKGKRYTSAYWALLITFRLFWSYFLKSVFGIPLFCFVSGFSCIWVGVVGEVLDWIGCGVVWCLLGVAR